DDNANVICLPARDLEQKEATDIIETWLKTSFSSAERHKRRLKKINEFE
ncbi:MAG: ribose-5-phosphate isomerase, partial [Parcubacteria group bacterium QH_9_35_7]